MDKEIVVARLIIKHLAGQSSDQEKQQLMSWLDADPHHVEVYNDVCNANWMAERLTTRNTVWQDGLVALQQRVSEIRKRRIIRNVVAAAAIIVIAVLTIPIFQQMSEVNERTVTKQDPMPKRDVHLVGKEQCLLQVEGYKWIDLDTVDNGVIGRYGDWQIIKDSQSISYQPMGVKKQLTPIYSRLITGPQRTYQFKLFDGTKVWVNARSDIRFPVYDDQQARKLELSGQAYFEVKNDSSRPFVVWTAAGQVEVLGTYFGVDASRVGRMEAALVKGLVRVNAGSHYRQLVPGEIAIVTPGNDIEVKKDSQLVSQLVNWRNGEFHFKDMLITDIMHQLQRWYDIDVKYVDTPKTLISTGKIPHSASLDHTLKILEGSKVVRASLKNSVVTISIP